MGAGPKRQPCLIGVGRRTWHPDEVGSDGAPEPLAMWEEVARQAADDAAATATSGGALLERLERIDVVYCQAWQYDDPGARLADRLGSDRAGTGYSGIGGTVPQELVARAATEILGGRLDLALVVGAEALATTRRLKKEGRRPDWSFRPDERRPFPFDLPFHPGEVAHGIFEAWLTFAMFDNAHRAHLGTGLDEHRRSLGRLLSPMTAVAAANPGAWFPRRRGVDEIVGPSADNRMVGYPYSKLMTAIMDVDMAAAVLLASDETADALGVPADRRIYLRGWGYARDPDALAERADLWRSGAMAAASAAALAGAGVGIDDVSHLDLYSCFASSVDLALDAVGIDRERARSDGPDLTPERPVTVTGGLAYHGGPGSNYVTHSLATMVEQLRHHGEAGALGLVSGVGMHMNKHAFGVYATDRGDCVPPDGEEVARHASVATVPVLAEATGPATVATYSVVHGRDGAPEWAALVCDLPGAGTARAGTAGVGTAGPGTRARCYARLDDAEALAQAERTELIGRPVELVADGPHTRAHLR